MEWKTQCSAWRRLLAEMAATCDPEASFKSLESAYGETARAYHTLEHIGACLEVFATARHLASAPGEIELAIWFHDIVYDTRRVDNEDLSARAAADFCQEAGLARHSASVFDMIIATKHALPDSVAISDTTLLIDVDLSILGADEISFDRYEYQIRQEYAWVPEPDFKRERGRILEAFVARPRIFGTQHFHDLLEARARHNLARSLDRLT
jgi:predicted metal-dependent HD superfamily phosphohydrolase